MCLIIDIHKWGRFHKAKNSRDMKPIWKWLRNREGKVVYSPTDKFKREWKSFPYRRDAEELQREGLVRMIPTDLVQQKEDELLGKIKSDDEQS